MALTRREFIKVLGAGSAAGLIGGCGNNADKLSSQDNRYEVAKTGNARISFTISRRLILTLLFKVYVSIHNKCKMAISLLPYKAQAVMARTILNTIFTL
jgi:hypothetical protein